MTGDSVYGADYALRRSIERQGRGYVLGVTRVQRLGFKPVADQGHSVLVGLKTDGGTVARRIR